MRVTSVHIAPCWDGALRTAPRHGSTTNEQLLRVTRRTTLHYVTRTSASCNQSKRTASLEGTPPPPSPSQPLSLRCRQSVPITCRPEIEKGKGRGSERPKDTLLLEMMTVPTLLGARRTTLGASRMQRKSPFVAVGARASNSFTQIPSNRFIFPIFSRDIRHLICERAQD